MDQGQCGIRYCSLEFYKEDIPSSGWVHVSYVSQENNRKRSLKFDGKEYTTL
jgi:hypothetical protein